MMQLRIESESWAYKVPFRVSRGVESALDVVVVTLTDAEGHIGRGEAAGVDYDGETVASLVAQIETVRRAIEGDLSRSGPPFEALARLLPSGGARNAVDCALWDLTCKRRGESVWNLAGRRPPRTLITCITLGIDSEEVLAAGARQFAGWPTFKVKVDRSRPIEPVRLVHQLNPKAAIIVDANQAWSCEMLNRLAPELQSLGAVLIEQPVPRGDDHSLRGYKGSLRLAADESVADRAGLAAIADVYQVINVKLDKSGGLSEALALASEVQRRGLTLMVGCMAGTSLAMAPAMVVGQFAEFVDLDGPLLHAHDREHGIFYDRGRMALPTAALWG
jgi:L-Ala-D/L-Glu epimerase